MSNEFAVLKAVAERIIHPAQAIATLVALGVNKDVAEADVHHTATTHGLIYILGEEDVVFVL